MRVMPKNPNAKRERLDARGKPVGVDREARVIRGYVAAQTGIFKTEGRGEFDELSLKTIVDLWPANGLKSRFTHPSESGGDGLGKFLGRARGGYLSTCVNADGQEVACVRADLYLDASAFEPNPNGNLGDYILTLAETDSDALSSSLVLSTKKEARREKDGKPMLDAEGKELPPLWRPLRLFASDVVDTGDAVDGFLSVAKLDAKPRWTHDYLSQGESLLNDLFAGQAREVVEARCAGFLTRYLDRRYGEKEMSKKKLAGEADPGFVVCPTCKGTGLCQNCGGTEVDPDTGGKCRACTVGECSFCQGDGQIEEEYMSEDDLAPAYEIQEDEEGKFWVYYTDSGRYDGPFDTEAEARAAADDAPFAEDEGASARPSVDVLRRRLKLKMKRKGDNLGVGSAVCPECGETVETYIDPKTGREQIEFHTPAGQSKSCWGSGLYVN